MESGPFLVRLVVAGVGIGAAVIGWLLTAEVVYMAGLATVAVVLLTAVGRTRRLLQRSIVIGATLAVLVVGIGVPLHVARSELTANRQVELRRGDEDRLRLVDDARTTAFPVSPGQSLLRSPDYLRLFDRSTGVEQWTLPARSIRYARPTVDGAVVLSKDGRITRITAQGEEAWVHEVDGGGVREPDAIAAADGTVVVEACERGDTEAEPYRPPCRYIGLAPDGSVAFEHTANASAVIALDDARNALGLLDGPLPSVYLTTGPDGSRQIRTAADGSVLERLDPQPQTQGTPAIAGDTALVPQQDGSTCSLMGHRDGGQVWQAEVSCWGGDVSASLLRHALLVGDRLWVYYDDELGADTVDLSTGQSWDAGEVQDISTAWEQPSPAGLPGSTAIAYLDGTRLSVADAADGHTQWQATMAGEVQQVWMMDAAIGVWTTSPSQLLFGSRESTDRLTVYDLETGDICDELLVDAESLEEIIPMSAELLVVRSAQGARWTGALLG